MKFFEKIAALQLAGTLNLSLLRHPDDTLSVTLYLNNDKTGDQAAKLIPPLLLKGTAALLDEQFFTAVSAPLQETSGLLLNMAAYGKGLDDARLKSKMKQAEGAKKKGDGVEEGEPAAVKEDKRRLYTDAIRKVIELEALTKYAEALEVMPQVAEHPDKEAEIGKRRADLERKRDLKKQMMFTDETL